MKRFYTLLFMILIIVSGCGTTLPGMALKNGDGGNKIKIKEASGVIRHIGKSTVALVMRKPDGVSAYCTGVWISENVIVTAHHCVQAAANYNAGDEEVDVDVDGAAIYYILENEVTGLEDEPSAVHLGNVVAEDSSHDLALVKIAGEVAPNHEIAEMAMESPGIGERLYFCGHTVGLYWTYVEGVVAAYRLKWVNTNHNGPLIQVSAPVYFGNSGGGAFNNDGELVGISSFLLRKVPNTAFYIHVDSVRKLMVEYKKP